MSDPHAAGLETDLASPRTGPGCLTVRSGIDGRISNSGVARYSQFDEHHLADVNTLPTDRRDRRPHRPHQPVGSHASPKRREPDPPWHGSPSTLPRRVIEEPGFIAHEISIDVNALEAITIEKIVTLFTSRDRSISDPLAEACSWSARWVAFAELLDAHTREWDDLWKRFSLEFEGDGSKTRLALHLHIFHLLADHLPQYRRSRCRRTRPWPPWRGLPRPHLLGRTLHLPLSQPAPSGTGAITAPLPIPAIARSSLGRTTGRLRGAMYPWQSGSNGREEAQVVHLNPLSGRWMPDASHLQRHINVAIAHNVWQYYQVTGDIEFMANYGAEMIFEICRFWASIAQYDPALERYEIVGVMGPDEYHDGYVGAAAPGLRNNAYTNVMAVWVLCRGLELVDLLPEPRRSELLARLSLDKSELARWDDCQPQDASRVP